MTRRVNVSLLGLALLGTCALMAGCNGAPGENAQGSRLRLAVIPKSMGADFWNNVEAGAREAAADYDVDVEWQGPLSETEKAEQLKIIDNMINLGVDGIALAPLDNKVMKRSVEEAVDYGIPVVIFDSAVDGDAHISYVATDNRHGGTLGAEKLVELFGGEDQAKGKRCMVMRFIEGTASTTERAEGCIESLQSNGVEVVADTHSQDGEFAGCKKAAANTLESLIENNRLELDGLFGCNDRSTLGALAALDDLRKSGVEVDVQVVGFDFTPAINAAMEDGTLAAYVAQNPRKMGYLSVETLVKHLRGEEIEEVIDTGVEMVTKERLANEPALRRLVGLEQ